MATKYKPEVTYGQRGRGLTYDKKKRQYGYEEDTRSGIPLPGQNEYIGPAMPSAAGAGRGLVVGPTAEDWRDAEEAGITTERKIKRGDYGPPGTAPTDPMPPMKPVKKARGGMIRGGGCEQRGKTKGRMV